MSRKTEATKASIKNAYINLLSTTSPLSISVTDICKACSINRSTFYAHYQQVDNLIEEIINEHMRNVSNITNDIYEKYYASKTTSREIIKDFFERFSTDEVLLKMIRSKDSRLFKELIVNSCYHLEISLYNVTDKFEQMKVYYRNYGVFAILFMWLEKPEELSLSEAAEVMYSILRNQ